MSHKVIQKEEEYKVVVPESHEGNATAEAIDLLAHALMKEIKNKPKKFSMNIDRDNNGLIKKIIVEIIE